MTPMLEIKFRAWSKGKKRMGAVHQVSFGSDDTGKVSPLVLMDVSLGTMSHTADIELMQFTGLKDRTGREIYEGDVVRNGDWNYLIRACTGGFECLACPPATGTYMFSILTDQCSIVGNIHESPQLLGEG